MDDEVEAEAEAQWILMKLEQIAVEKTLKTLVITFVKNNVINFYFVNFFHTL
jgi:hypothetical protein